MRKTYDQSNFLSARQKVQLVAAEVRRQAEDAAKRARDDEEKRKGRRDRLRELYRKHIPEEGLAVDFDEVRNLVEGIASTTYGGPRARSASCAALGGQTFARRQPAPCGSPNLRVSWFTMLAVPIFGYAWGWLPFYTIGQTACRPRRVAPRRGSG